VIIINTAGGEGNVIVAFAAIFSGTPAGQVVMHLHRRLPGDKKINTLV
jgi:hypothetical protein